MLKAFSSSGLFTALLLNSLVYLNNVVMHAINADDRREYSWVVEHGEVYFLSSDWNAPANLELFIRSINASALLGAVDLLAESSRVRIGKRAGWSGYRNSKTDEEVIISKRPASGLLTD